MELPVNKVDIIICDWMGSFLLYNSSIEQLIFARDKWLNKEGLVYKLVIKRFFQTEEC